MGRWLVLVLACVTANLLSAHPMGNFSVNHYARIDVSAKGSTLIYILDFAEIPTLELTQEWKLSSPDKKQLEQRAEADAGRWLANVIVTDQDGLRVLPRVHSVEAQSSEGAGGMPILRIGIEASLRAAPGTLHYKDENYPSRAGWKEIVINAGKGAAIDKASHTSRDLSHRLTVYPIDPAIVPPQDLEALLTWSAVSLPADPVPAAAVAELPKLSSAQQPPLSKSRTPASGQTEPVKKVAPSAPPSRSSSAQQAPAAGTLRTGDYLSTMIRSGYLSLNTILLGVLAAFGLGAMHALSPGHGKTIVAAYLVGSRGTLKHALLLGSTVTFTHTVSVFLLGMGVLMFQQYVVPERIIPVLGAASGASIVCIGGFLLYKRLLVLSAGGADCGHSHQHIEELEAAWAEDHGHGRGEMAFLPKSAGKRDFVHTHTHDGITHSHVLPEDQMTMSGLIALGASGGLVPCPSALILMLSAIAVGHTALGLGLLVSFSAGLAVVLMGIGAVVIYAKNWLPADAAAGRHAAFRFVPVFSAVVVIVLGILMTLTSVGVLQPLRFLS